MNWLIGLAVAVFIAIPAPAALADPLVDKVKDFVNQLEPRGEAFWNIEANEWQGGISGTVYPVKDWFDVKLGHGVNKTVYTGVDTDLYTLSDKILVVRDILSVVPLQVQKLAKKYSRIGVVAGYSWDSNDVVYGPTFGASIEW